LLLSLIQFSRLIIFNWILSTYYFQFNSPCLNYYCYNRSSFDQFSLSSSLLL